MRHYLAMRILTRYVLLELVKVFVLAMFALTPMMLIVGLFQEAMRYSLPPAEILRLVPYTIPFALSVAIPVTLLLATTGIYARMSGSNEIIALKAQGISPWAVIWPSVVVAFVLSLGTVWLTDLAVSWGRNGAQRVIIEAVEEIAYGVLRTRRSYSSSAFSVNVKRVEGQRLIRPTLSIRRRDGSPTITITAAEAKLSCDKEEGVLKVVLWDGYVDMEGEGAFRFPNDVWEQEIPLTTASRVEDRSHVPSNIALGAIRRETAGQIERIDTYRRELAVRAAFEILSGDFDQLTGREWQTRQRLMEDHVGRLHRLHTEPHRRWSAGFSCFCFLWVGAPMAIRLRNRDFLTSFFLCFTPILVVYYPIMMYGIDGAKSGTIPPYTVWAGNLILLVWGFYLLRKVLRY
ncbi:MAG: LptF/LptG family permease [Pirellulales bacterium]|nr:LptF/LptG family permease [Thermoguttaceae bacterium]MDD4786598.1 LptF/LptG family permease [Pirellulales bacterium]MDI9446279.1 LptF/LptG family permease [Planctomycetota bacterium]NLZ00831.1 YjgP/YjgQ family permease [Pirellulaceae bacterium]